MSSKTVIDCISCSGAAHIKSGLSKLIWRATADRISTTLPLKWLTDQPVCVDQCPLNKEKLQVLKQLVQEQLEAQHTETLGILYLSLNGNLENRVC